MPKVILRAADRNIDVELTPGGAAGHWTVGLDGAARNADVTWIGPNEGRLRLDDRIIPFFIHSNGTKHDIWVDGHVHRLDSASGAKRGDAGHADAAAGSDLRAPMPGTILRVNAKPGATAKVNEPMVVMVSMKMEMTLNAPRAGRIKAVHCSENQLVEMGALLVELAEDSDAEPA